MWRAEVELLQRRVSRMARMEEAIERQREAQRAQRDTLQRRLLNAALAVRTPNLAHACFLLHISLKHLAAAHVHFGTLPAYRAYQAPGRKSACMRFSLVSSGRGDLPQVGCVGAGALAAYLAVRWLQSPARMQLELPQMEHSAAAAQPQRSRAAMGPDSVDMDAASLPHGLLSSPGAVGASHSSHGPLGALESTMSSGGGLSTAEILQSAAAPLQQAGGAQAALAEAAADAAKGACMRDTASAWPGFVHATEARFSDTLPTQLGGGARVCASSCWERPLWARTSLLWRLAARV